MKIYLLLFASSFLVACQTLRVQIPIPSVDSPELVDGKGKISGEFGLRAIEHVVITDNAGARPPVFGTQQDSYKGLAPFIYIGPNLSPTFSLKIGAIAGELNPNGVVGKFQWQMFGSPHGQSAAGNQSLALTGEITAVENSAKGDQEYFGGPGGRDWKAKARMSSSSGSLAYGYRASNTLLIFLGGGYGRFRTSGNIEQSATSTYAAGNYDIPPLGGVTASGALGFDIGKEGALIFKLVYYQVRFDNGINRDRSYAELSYAF